MACVSGATCGSNPGAPCRTGVTACPGGANSAATCTDGAIASGDCGAFMTSGCSYANSCANDGTLTGTQPTCSNGTCSGSRQVNQPAHPSCTRNREGVVCFVSGSCSGGSQCHCVQQITSTCQSGTCLYESETTLTCGFCQQQCNQL